MNERLIKYGDFLVVDRGDFAIAYDMKTGRKLFRGELEQVLKELHEKIEGSFNVDFNFDFNLKQRRRGEIRWEF